MHADKRGPEIHLRSSAFICGSNRIAFQPSRVTTAPTLSKPRMDAPFLSSLNPQQRSAATAPLETPTLIVAGAGTGKTNTLAHRVAHLIHTGTSPSRILLLTFTRR